MLVLNIPNPFSKSNYKSFELSCKANLKMQWLEEEEKVKTSLLFLLLDLRVINCREVQARNAKLSLSFLLEASPFILPQLKKTSSIAFSMQAEYSLTGLYCDYLKLTDHFSLSRCYYLLVLYQLFSQALRRSTADDTYVYKMGNNFVL